MNRNLLSRLKLLTGAAALAALWPRRVGAAENSDVSPQLTLQQQIDTLQKQLGTTRSTVAALQSQLADAQAQLAKLKTHTHLYDPPHDNVTATLADINLWNKMGINQTNMVFMMNSGGYGRDTLTGPPQFGN
jgi:septal ring factor EnvC (AmiA/AmiB activator)